MKRMIITAAAALILTGCGRTVEPMGENNCVVPGRPSAELPAADLVSDTEPSDDEHDEFKCPEKLIVDTSMRDGHILSSSHVIPDFKTVLQCPELPTGCEITALTEVLNFYGFGIDKEELCDNFLPIDCTGTKSMDEAYIGDPHWEDGFGCNAPVIAKAANDYLDYLASDWYAVDLTGISFDEMLYQVEQGRPAIVWTTIDQVYCTKQYYPQIDMYFNGMQHCLAVYGYDKDANRIHCADPLKGNMEYNMATFETLYGIMDKQVVVLIGNESSAGVDYSDDEYKEKWMAEHRPEEESQ